MDDGLKKAGLDGYFPEREKQDVIPAASRGATHASRGWPWMATPGLREAGIAKRNGFTAVRKIPVQSGLRA
jgi:hypothetical protein